MHVIVIKKSDTTPYGYTPIYIGRGSVFGNPFPMTNQSQQARDSVCEAFLAHLKEQWRVARKGQHSPLAHGVRALATRVAQGERLALQCFCAPKRCHGDAIKHTIEWLVSSSH